MYSWEWLQACPGCLLLMTDCRFVRCMHGGHHEMPWRHCAVAAAALFQFPLQCHRVVSVGGNKVDVIRQLVTGYVNGIDVVSSLTIRITNKDFPNYNTLKLDCKNDPTKSIATQALNFVQPRSFNIDC
jgi:hypothetical protein